MSYNRALVVVGASHAGLQVAVSAREFGFEERIFLIGEEPHAPYQRPALSKGVLTGRMRAGQLALRSPEFFQANGIELLTQTRVQAVQPATRRVLLHDATTLEYGSLVLATGASPKPLRLAGADLQGVFQLRTLDDAQAIATAAGASQRACVIGGGYIGLEVAAALAGLGKEVTVLEADSRVLARSVPPFMSAYVQAVHARHGVDLRTGQRIRRLASHLGHVVGVELEDGSLIDCDMAVLGVGVSPNAGLAQDACLAVSDGIEVDAQARTSAPGVLAVGDVACMPLPPWMWTGRSIRLESIHAAVETAKIAAATLVGRSRPWAAVPWFWSDQFDLKLQIAGMAWPGDEAVVRGDIESDRFSVAYLRAGRLVAMHSVNRPAEHMVARKLIAAQVRPRADELSDPAYDLNALISNMDVPAES